MADPGEKTIGPDDAPGVTAADLAELSARSRALWLDGTPHTVISVMSLGDTWKARVKPVQRF